MRRRSVLAVSLLVLLSVAGVFAVLHPTPGSGCPSILDGRVVKTQLQSTTFGAVTTFSLPSHERWPNAIAVEPDGSVWFGEEAVPALAHFFVANRTLVEYSFPGSYPQDSSKGYTCADKTDIWGVALWDGRVWAADSAQNRLLGLSAVNDSFKVVSLAATDSLPYTLTPGPDGALWFTQTGSGQIGTLFVNGTVAEHSVKVTERINGTSASVSVPGVPAQIVFANSTLGYYVDASPLIIGPPVFAFNPGDFSPEPIGGNLTLVDSDSISLGDGGVWVVQHGDSSVAFADLKDGTWTVYPTSGVSYIGTTLPYFVETNGSLVWFNEHFGNRMAVLDSRNNALTEYSLSNPPAGNMSQLDNALTFALGGARAWFTESTSNAIGYVDASYKPSFSVSTGGSPTFSVKRGGSHGFQVDVGGQSSSPISIQLAASGQSTSSGANITMRASQNEFGSLSGNQSTVVTVSVGSEAAPGRYTLIVTATDGLVSRSLYFELTVLP